MTNRCENGLGRSNLAVLRRFVSESDAATATEYAVMLALVLVVIITTVATLGTTVSTEYEEANTALFA